MSWLLRVFAQTLPTGIKPFQSPAKGKPHPIQVFEEENKTSKGLPPADLIQVYCSLVRPILEYASPVWAALPNCLVQLVESVQKSALRIIFPDCSYESALVRCGLPTLLSRRDEACRRFISNIKESGFLSHLLPQPTNVAHGYGLRSGFCRSEFRFGRTDRLSNFVTHSYNKI